MQTIFCTECGHKMVYAGSKPKFCSSCGVSMNGDASAAPASSPPPQSDGKRKLPSFRERMESKLQGTTDVSEDETDINYVPHVGKLEYDISDGGFGNPTHKFEDVINVSTEEKAEEKPQRKRGRPRKKR